MKISIILGIVALVLAVLTGGFAALYFNQSADINTLKEDMKSLRESAPATGVPALTPGSLPADVAAHVAASVVRVDVTGNGFVSVGSGFIISNNGYVLTNHHVIVDALAVVITMVNGDRFSGKVVDFDQARDVALIKMVTDRSDLPEIGLATGRDVTPGTEVTAVGYPLGLELPGPPSFTAGIVSAVRTIDGLSYIQTDAALNAGNSGGPLVNYYGEVVGVCTGAIVNDNLVSPSIGLAIPIADSLSFMSDGKVGCAECHSVAHGR